MKYITMAGREVRQISPVHVDSEHKETVRDTCPGYTKPPSHYSCYSCVVFGLGWALGLAATSFPVKELTFILQILFSVFVGIQGVLLFLLHGVRNKDIRKVWIQCFAVIGRNSRLASVISSTKTSSAGPESLGATRNTSGISALPHKRDEYSSAAENAYCQQPYQSSKGGSIAMEMVLAGDSDWGQSERNFQKVSFADSDEEHIYDDAWS